LFYSLALTLSGLNFGFLIGFITGLLSFIPFVGMGIGVFTALLVGCFQWGLSLSNFIVVISIFTAGQIIESNFLTPRLVGKKIGLHPVWIIFGLFVFGSLFGFIGVLLAIPLTAIFGVILKFFAAKYKESFCHTQSNS
jgi:predicted PurR-regulated permease PerM